MASTAQRWLLRWDVNQQVHSVESPDEAEIEQVLMALNNETRTQMVLEYEGVGSISVMGGKRVLVRYVPANSDTNPRRLVEPHADPTRLTIIGQADGHEDLLPASLTTEKSAALQATLVFFHTQTFAAALGWIDDWPLDP